MIAKGAFSILEVLLATVLLAIVVAVCTPYLRVGVVPSPEASREQFDLQVREAIRKQQHTHRSRIDYQVYAEAALLNGWTCKQVHGSSQEGGNQGLGGTWVWISDGRASSVHWVAPVNGGAP